MDFQWYFPIYVLCSVVFSKGLSLSRWIFTGIVQWTFSGIFQWNFTFVISGTLALILVPVPLGDAGEELQDACLCEGHGLYIYIYIYI